jgi:hypothetical protein
MLTMQYGFVLPSSFDMRIIRERIASKGPLLDDFQGLTFKAYLYACHGEHGPENLYSPFYVWAGTEAMNRFLLGPGFAALVRDFGWPAVKTGSVLCCELSPELREAQFATREELSIPPHSALASMAEAEQRMARSAVADESALAAVTAYDPATWTLVRFRLWREPRDAAGGVRQYAVGHVSAPRSE